MDFSRPVFWYVYSFVCFFNFLREMSGQERFLKTLMFELALKVEESLGRRREGRGMVEMKMG